MLIFQIVVEGNRGSTGTMAENISQHALKKGYKSIIAYGRFKRKSQSELYKIGNFFSILWHVVLTRIFDLHGLGSNIATKKLIRKIKEVRPDIIHLHHLHGYYVNYKILFKYLRESNTPIVWTFHDCWAFTGHCAHFDYIRCVKWQTECLKCPQKKVYPASWIFDRSNKNFHLKKLWFSGIENLKIITPSNWLRNTTRMSFLGQYETKVIHNGVDLDVFYPSTNNSEIVKRIDVYGKFVILGVASPWTPKKGFDEFIELSKVIDESMVIFLVGVTRSQSKNLPRNIKSIERTESSDQLRELYSVADVFVNLTLEDTFPTVNLEALACGTPIISYNSGGSPESVFEGTGFVVERNSINDVLSSIGVIKGYGKNHFTEHCRRTAEIYFSKEKQISKYFQLYTEIRE